MYSSIVSLPSISWINIFVPPEPKVIPKGWVLLFNRSKFPSEDKFPGEISNAVANVYWYILSADDEPIKNLCPSGLKAILLALPTVLPT